MVEWLSQRVMHKAYPGGGCGKSEGLTFREQDEQAEKRKKKRAAKKQSNVIQSKISEAMELLRKAILSEMDELVEKHKEKCRRCRK